MVKHRSCLAAVCCDLLCAIFLSFFFSHVKDCLTTQQGKESISQRDGMNKSPRERGKGWERVSPLGVQCWQKRRPDASQFQLGNGSWQQAWASHTWTQSQSAGIDGSLQAAFQRLLDLGSMGDEGRWLHYNQKLIAVNRVRRDEWCASRRKVRECKERSIQKHREIMMLSWMRVCGKQDAWITMRWKGNC